MQLLTVVANGNLYMEQTNEFKWDWSFVMILIMLLVSALLLLRFALAVIKIKKLIIKNPVKKWNDINFVFTNAKGTPFSFFKYIFWNDQININSTVGDQILKHELAHVYEKHSIDKLFLSLAVIVNWYNPFLWLIRKELNMIHEFIADEKAINNGDTSAFAAMLLETAYPAHSSMLINSFFHSPIKRRLLMITSSKKTSFTYLRRIVILPLLAFTCLLFAFTFKKDRLSQNVANTNSYQANKNYLNLQESTSAIEADVQDTTFSRKRSNTAKVTINNRDTTQTTDAANSKSKTKMNVSGKDSKSNLNKTLVVLDGKEMSWQEFEKKEVKPENIQSMNVLKDKSATDKYGDKGKDGVIEITSKTQNLEQKNFENERDKQEQLSMYSKVFTKVENPPYYGNGMTALAEFINNNMQYPKDALQSKVEGAVLIQFIVNNEGKLTNFKKLSNKGHGLEEEAIRLLKNSGDWKPGIQNGRKVAVEVQQQVIFKLPKTQ